MQIKIHRGTHQIGGCITEIRTNKTRIIIDFGSELDSSKEKDFQLTGVTNGKSDCGAVFFSHYHGDHIGLIDTINNDIPLYMGKDAKKILEIFNSRVRAYSEEKISGINTFSALSRIIVGDIKITPLFTDHSAYDAYMFLVEADGKRVLHTGDFRSHGFLGKGVIPALKKYVGKVDTLICEGTTLGRNYSKNITENDLNYQIKDVLEKNKYVFVICSSTNIDRIASVCSAVPYGKYCLCDSYQYKIIEYIRTVAGDKSSLYQFKKLHYYGNNLKDKMKKQGFCMFARIGSQFFKELLDEYSDAVIIYSMWSGYLADESTKMFLNGHKLIKLHTSGHADIQTLEKVVETVNPDQIIPIHTDEPEKFNTIAGKAVLKNAHDSIEISIGG